MLTLLLFLCFLPPTVAMLLVAWLVKNAFVEYIKLFRLTKWFHVAEFIQAASNDAELAYPTFLVMYWDSWLTRLLSCPICLSVWIAAIFTVPFFLLYNLWLLIPGTFFVAYAGLILYFKLIKMMK